jgi:hypothetical protein
MLQVVVSSEEDTCASLWTPRGLLRESARRFRASCKINFSFSPGFSLGLVAPLKAKNRFNGLQSGTSIWAQFLKTVKTVREVHCRP